MSYDKMVYIIINIRTSLLKTRDTPSKAISTPFSVGSGGKGQNQLPPIALDITMLVPATVSSPPQKEGVTTYS